jgi:calcineurin-like phosphoesterase family protein
MAKNKDIFVTSDLWFNRPIGEFSFMSNYEYNNMVIDNWNRVVGKRVAFSTQRCISYGKRRWL